MEEKKLYGYLVEFDTAADIYHAAEKVREQGYQNWDVHTPFPVHGMDSAMGIRRTSIPWLVFGGGAAGCAIAFLLQWWTNAFDYPIIVSGKPLFSVPANIPIVFELIVLFSALTAVGALLAFNGFPQLYHPLFNSERFKQVTRDKFFISVESSDPKFDEHKTKEFLSSLGGAAVEAVEE